MTAWGFCLAEQTDVPAGPDRRCQNDGAFVIAPSWSDREATWRGGNWYPHAERPDGYTYRPPAVVRGWLPSLSRFDEARIEIERSGFTIQRPLDAAPAGAPAVEQQPADRVCMNCQTTFAARQNNNRWCTPRCRAQFANALRRSETRARLSERSCAWCETVFMPTMPHQVCCSKACLDRRMNARRRGVYEAGKTPAIAMTPCVACAIQFQPFRKSQRYCSTQCGVKYRSSRPETLERRRQPMSAKGRACSRCGRDDRPYGGKGLCHPCHVARHKRAGNEAAA